MVSRSPAKPRRLPPHERRAEIVAEAAAIALDEGLERITLRAVAERLGVRPGLISHYFPAVEELVAEALDLALSVDRETLFPASGSPVERVAALVIGAQSGESRNLARLWLNARHLARFSPAIAENVVAQEALNRDRLITVIEEGVRSGTFRTSDAAAAAEQILIAIDGVGSYVNNTGDFDEETYTTLIERLAEWALGLEVGTLRDAAAVGASRG